jgi:DNA polymerase (family 10)
MTRRLVAAMRHPLFKIWGHPLGRLLRRRPPADCDVDAVLDALAESRGAVEVNGDPHRLDMEPRLLRRAKERGLKFVISTDAHSTSNLDFLEYGVAIARRGWLTPSDVLNTLDAGAFAEAVRPRAAARGGRSGA